MNNNLDYLVTAVHDRRDDLAHSATHRHGTRRPRPAWAFSVHLGRRQSRRVEHRCA